MVLIIQASSVLEVQKWQISEIHKNPSWLKSCKGKMKSKSSLFGVFFPLSSANKDNKGNGCGCEGKGNIWQLEGYSSQRSGSKSAWAFASVFNMGDQVGHRGIYQMVKEKEIWRSRSFCSCYRGQTLKSWMLLTPLLQRKLCVSVLEYCKNATWRWFIKTVKTCIKYFLWL